MTGSPQTPARRLRVLHLLDSFSFGGAENLLVELARFDPPDMELHVASLAPRSQGRNQMLDRLTEVGFRPTYLDVPRLLDPLSVVRAASTIRRGRYDVVHAHLGYSAVVGTLAARMAGVPSVATLHLMPGHVTGGERLKERLAVKVPATLGLLVFVSSAALHGFAERYGPATSSWRMVQNGIDIARFQLPRQLTTEPTWAVVAALREEKGHLDLLQAWRELLKQAPTAHLLIAGDGYFQDRIAAEIDRLGLAEHVTLLGRCDDVPSLLARVDGIVSASWTEGLPTSLIEAGAAGLPAVATDVGGTREVIDDGVTGLLAPAHEPRTLAAALARVVTEPDLAARLGRNAAEKTRKEFAMEVWVENLRGLYADVITRAAGNGGRRGPRALTRRPGRAS